MKFVKYNNYWYEYDTTTNINNATIYNPYGGCMSNVDLSSYEIVSSKNFETLNWYKTCVYDNKYMTGWLAPNGIFYGCDYKSHKEQANFVHKLTEEEIEEKGFIKITFEDRFQTKLKAMLNYHYVKEIPITTKQLEFLKKHPIDNYLDSEYVYNKLKYKLNDNNLKNNNDLTF